MCLKELAATRLSYGYRRAHIRLRREQREVNEGIMQENAA